MPWTTDLNQADFYFHPWDAEHRLLPDALEENPEDQDGIEVSPAPILITSPWTRIVCFGVSRPSKTSPGELEWWKLLEGNYPCEVKDFADKHRLPYFPES